MGISPARPPSRPSLTLPGAVISASGPACRAWPSETVAAIIAEVPGYEDALSGPMGEQIRTAVRLALGGFLSLAGGRRGPRHPGRPADGPAVEGAYQLGRGEARSGRTTEALLAAYRIGARVSWRQMSGVAVASGIEADRLASFAELVFAYIDELSAASIAGHADELATTGQVRDRLLGRIARQLLAREPAEVVLDAAERADWVPPQTLTAVLLPQSQVRSVLASTPAGTLLVTDLGGDPGLDDQVLLLVPDAHGHRRTPLLRSLADRQAVLGPATAWLEVHRSYDRVLRIRALGVASAPGTPVDTEEHLTQLVLTADPDALADLQHRVLAPLADLRPATAEKLAETLRAWLLHLGRRDEVADELFVHPQTVRYRMTQLREVFGDTLEDPATVLALTLALGAAPGTPRRAEPG